MEAAATEVAMEAWEWAWAWEATIELVNNYLHSSHKRTKMQMASMNLICAEICKVQLEASTLHLA